MKSRRLAREAALQALYLCDALGDFSSHSLELFRSHFLKNGFLDDAGESDSSREIDGLYHEIVRGVVEGLEQIDESIGLSSTNWSVSRMTLIDRNIIRIAVYEMLMRTDIPAKVSINEAIEIAKDFSSPESTTFVNGVLDKIAEQLGRKGA